MKARKFIPAIAFLITSFVACEKKEDIKPSSTPIIESLTVKTTGNIILNDSLYFDIKGNDPKRPLSTLEVTLTANEIVLDKKSIRTKGMTADLKNISLFVPFNPYIATGENLVLNFTLINVDGAETHQQKVLKAQRPELPDKLFLLLTDKTVITLDKNTENPYLYESSTGNYPSSFSAKITSNQNLTDAKYIWNGSTDDNIATLGKEFGADVKFSYDNWIVKKIIFDTYSFNLDVQGLRLAIKVNNTLLRLSDEYLYAQVPFKQGEEFTIEGLDNVAQAYNRDFFEYNPATGKYKFLAETGNWDVYYSPTYNYIWVNKTKDIAPQAYWILGQGFTSVPRWHNDFTDIGWSWTDIKQLSYMRRISPNQYQADVYLSNKPQWGLDMKIYSSLNSDDYKQAIFSDDRFYGDKTGFQAAGRDKADVVSNDDFVEGYYRITLDISDGLDNAKLTFKKL